MSHVTRHDLISSLDIARRADERAWIVYVAMQQTDHLFDCVARLRYCAFVPRDDDATRRALASLESMHVVSEFGIPFGNDPDECEFQLLRTSDDPEISERWTDTYRVVRLDGETEMETIRVATFDSAQSVSVALNTDACIAHSQTDAPIVRYAIVPRSASASRATFVLATHPDDSGDADERIRACVGISCDESGWITESHDLQTLRLSASVLARLASVRLRIFDNDDPEHDLYTYPDGDDLFMPSGDTETDAPSGLTRTDDPDADTSLSYDDRRAFVTIYNSGCAPILEFDYADARSSACSLSAKFRTIAIIYVSEDDDYADGSCTIPIARYDNGRLTHVQTEM